MPTPPRKPGLSGFAAHAGRVSPTSLGGADGPVPRRVQIIREARQRFHANELEKAAASLQPLIDSPRPDPEALFLAGLIAERSHRPHEARVLAKRSLAALEHPDAMLLLARCERIAGNTDECVRLCDQAARKPSHAHIARVIKAGSLEEGGRFDDARAIVEPLVDQAAAAGTPLDPGIKYEWAKLLVQFKRYDEAIVLLDELIDLEATPEELRRLQLHLRAKACDRRKDYAGAYESAKRANDVGKLAFSPELYTEQVSALIEIWSRENIARFPKAACDSQLPVFVAGMPRSGTSLIDQIIDAHPKAAGVGELATIESLAKKLSVAYDPGKEPPDCFGDYRHAHKWTDAAMNYVRELRKLAPDGAERVVNKALGNNKLLGLISRLFPNTRIIHAIRDPRDVAVSCFMGGFNNWMHPWTTQLDWVAHAWAQSVRMMDHWKQVLDVPILEVHYERLVTDPDTEFPRITEFLGLEWDDACREFHKSRRTVRTLSYDQVNRPLYTSSAGRNANYAEWMAGIDWPAYDPHAA